jgi:hypothetical protein
MSSDQLISIIVEFVDKIKDKLLKVSWFCNI